MIEIIVDTRERMVIPFFNEYSNSLDVKFSIQQVNVGDYSILYNGNILFVIERKTWKDLASSMRDGRKHNVNKMIKLREDTGCQIIYLIEGNPLPPSNTKFCRVPYKALRSHLDHLSFRDNIHIVHSKNTKHTVERIYELIKNFLSIKPSPLLKYDIAGSGEEQLKEKTEITPEAINYKIWCCVPGINEITASLFIHKGYHISDLVLGKISKDEIYALKYSNNSIIGSRSNKIWNNSRINETTEIYFIKMLSQISGITKKTAEIILKSINLEELLNDNININTLSEIKKSPNRKVGNKIASSILLYFIKHTLVSTNI
jgi:ERCC4-type nuclease